MAFPCKLFQTKAFPIPMPDCYLVKDFYVGSHAPSISVFSVSNGYIGALTEDCPDGSLAENEMCVCDYDWTRSIISQLGLGQSAGRKEGGFDVFVMNIQNIDRYVISPELQVQMLKAAAKDYDKREQRRKEGTLYGRRQN